MMRMACSLMILLGLMGLPSSAHELRPAYLEIRQSGSEVFDILWKVPALGGAITREPGPVKGGTTVIAFITDPDGYKIELIERD